MVLTPPELLSVIHCGCGKHESALADTKAVLAEVQTYPAASSASILVTINVSNHYNQEVVMCILQRSQFVEIFRQYIYYDNVFCGDYSSLLYTNSNHEVLCAVFSYSILSGVFY